MLPGALPLTLILLAFGSLPAAPQTTASAAQGLAILTQALNASGAANPMNPIQDFTATGTITYFWAGEEVQGPATVRARGADQFRLDANLPQGIRSWAISRGSGALKETDGTITEIPLHNIINVGILTFPYLNITAALNDPLTAVSYLGVVESGGRQVHQVRVQRNFPQEADPDGTVSRLCVTTYFIDALTGLVVKTLDMTHSDDNLREDFAHELELGNYAAFHGVNVPMLVREKIIGQTVWELRLANISFNAELSDLDFQLR